MKCFVIMPFGNDRVDATRAEMLEELYSVWIKPAVESVLDPATNTPVACHRADKELRPGEIITHVIEQLTTADIVIADLSGRNPNVFYELGVRHAVSDNTILLSDNPDDIPFDLRGLRAISFRPGRMMKMKEELQKAVRQIAHDPIKIDNPVRQFFQNRDALASRSPIPGSDAVTSLLAEIASLRSELARQSTELRAVVQSLATNRVALSSSGKPIDLSFFEGAWRNVESGTHFYARIVDGELLMPYCYHGNDSLDAQYHHFRLIGDTLVGRFTWIAQPDICGFVILKQATDNALAGGWWYADQVESDSVTDVAGDYTKIPGMNRSELVRLDCTKFPDWAEKYFADAAREGPGTKRAAPANLPNES